jgi:uncharacterized membrane protein YfcA
MTDPSTILLLSVACGAIVGLSLGLTGGGGAIFAVPLLVYGLRVPASQAVGISLAAVGATSLAGFLHRWRLGEVELQTGLIFAIAGMLGAPLGSWISGRIPPSALLLAFAGLMLYVAVRMWRSTTANKRPDRSGDSCGEQAPRGATCQRDASGKLVLTSRCGLLLVAIGVATGVLSGLFGVGGGFVIVPALVLFSGMSMHHAVGTSLMVIALVSVSGVTAHLTAGRQIDLALTALFITGGVAGLFAGQQLGRRMSGPVLARVFAGAIVAVAIYVILRNIYL